MFTPQLTAEPTGYGLGFAVGEFRGHRVVRHTGAVYGFTSSLTLLPDERLAVVVLANEDIATGPVARLVEARILRRFRRGMVPDPAGRTRQGLGAVDR